METTLIDVFDKTYELCDQIQYRDHERAAYEEICAEVFPGLSFEKWYKAGYWDGNLFNPHVLKDGDRILSAVSVNKMNIKIGKEPSRLYIQLGGVMTAKDHRNQGLSTVLMDKILTNWEDNCDGIYLFGHEGVRDISNTSNSSNASNTYNSSNSYDNYHSETSHNEVSHSQALLGTMIQATQLV